MRTKTKLFIAAILIIAGTAGAADQRIQYTEEMVGAGHPTKGDTLNRLMLIEHNTDGTHKADAGTTLGVVLKSTYNANSILAANADDTPAAVTIAEQQVAGRITGGDIKGLSVAELQTLIGSVQSATFDANTILAANADNTPAAVTIAEQQVVGRITGGNIKGLSIAEIRTLIGSLQNVVEDTTPQLGGNLDTNKKLILHNAALNDHEAEGRAVTGTAGENLAQGNVVYKKLNGGAWKWYKYDCNGTDKLILPTGIATAAITSGNTGAILIDGQMRDDTWSLSPSADTAVTVYASATAGGVTLTAPSTSGDQVVVVGFLVGGNTIQTAFGYAWIEI
ncbi:MAG: hypothetical protein JXL20_05170 [Deltaproteobacteria bacterium]|nr:hypothetical protein [Deltaproteobacteria bacterium]